MFIVVSNNPDKIINNENYDKIIYLGFMPKKELVENEIVLLSSSNILINDFYVSMYGICKNNNKKATKKEFENSFLSNVNQILLNERPSNIKNELSTGEIHYYVGLGSHYELEI